MRLESLFPPVRKTSKFWHHQVGGVFGNNDCTFDFVNPDVAKVFQGIGIGHYYFFG